MNVIKIPGSNKFVVQVSYLREIDRGGAPHYDPSQVIAVADSLEEARSIAVRFPEGPSVKVRILEVFPPVDLGGGSLRFLAPMPRAVVDPAAVAAKPVRKPRKARAAA